MALFAISKLVAIGIFVVLLCGLPIQGKDFLNTNMFFVATKIGIFKD